VEGLKSLEDLQEIEILEENYSQIGENLIKKTIAWAQGGRIH
jgi:hypothetical protein